jgi:hypothetical protein
LLDPAADQHLDGGLNDGLQLGVVLVAVDLEQADIVLAVGAASELGVHGVELMRQKAMR